METVEPIKEERQINAMKAILKDKNIRDYAMFTLGINSGLRISDLLKLKVGDIIDVKGKVKDRIAIKEKKTGKPKDFPLGATAIRALKEYMDSKPDLDRNSYLFKSKKGDNKPISRQQAWAILNNAAKSVGITTKVGTHTLRKTFGFHSFKQGKDITLVQRLLNHSAPSITLAYIGITREDLDNVYLTLNL